MRQVQAGGRLQVGSEAPYAPAARTYIPTPLEPQLPWSKSHGYWLSSRTLATTANTVSPEPDA